MFEEMPGVIAAYPDGYSRTITVHQISNRKIRPRHVRRFRVTAVSDDSLGSLSLTVIRVS